MDSVSFPTITLDHMEAAAKRIKGRVRRTPCLRARFIRHQLHPNLMLKLECLQVTGSFKARGANNAVLSLDEAAVQRGIITASSGNHGVATAYAGYASGTKSVIYLPGRVGSAKAEQLARWGAEVVIEGDVWDDANDAALAHAERDGLTYIHPFADPAVIAGQSTVALEMLKQSPDIDVILVGIGGGGLISGIALAAKAIKPEIQIIGVEPEGAPTLKTAVDAGQLMALDDITTQALSLAPRASAAVNLDIIQRYVDDIRLVSDDAMRDAARWLFLEMGIAAELSGAAALAALQSAQVNVPEDACVAVVVCGAGRDGIT
jgi:threonine dehydratase